MLICLAVDWIGDMSSSMFDGSPDMKARFLWTLERADSDLMGGLATLEELAELLESENLPGVAPADWIVTGLVLDEDANGVAEHVSPFGWRISIKRVQSDVAAGQSPVS